MHVVGSDEAVADTFGGWESLAAADPESFRWPLQTGSRHQSTGLRICPA